MLFPKQKVVLLFFFISLVVVMTQTASAQSSETPTPTPVISQEELDLDEKIRIAEKKAKLAKAVKEAADTAPTPTSTPITTDSSGVKDLKMEASIQTYKAARQITDRIACDIRQNIRDANVFILYKQDLYLGWRNYKSMDKALKEQLSDMQEEYEIWLLNDAIAQANFFNKHGLASNNSAENQDGGPVTAVASTALLGAATAVRSLVDLLAMFKTNVDYTYLGVNVNDNALKSMVSDSLRRTSFNGKCEQGAINMSTKVYDPDTYYPLDTQEVAIKNGNKPSALPGILVYVDKLSKFKRVAEVEIAIYDIIAADITKFGKDAETSGTNLAAIEEKLSLKTEAERSLSFEIAKTTKAAEKKALSLNLAKLQQEITVLSSKKRTTENNITKIKNSLNSLEEKMDLKYRLKISRLKQLNADFGQFFSALNTRDATSQVSPLMQYTKIESLDKILDDPKSYWVETRSIEAGGANRVQKNLLRYFYKPDISFSGGSIIEFSVSNKEGAVVISNTNSAYEKYRKASNILK